MFEQFRDAIRAGVPTALLTITSGPQAGAKVLIVHHQGSDPSIQGSLGDPDLDRVAIRDATGELAAGRTGVRRYGPQGQIGEATCPVFIESFAPPPRLLIFGAVDFTAALLRVAKVLGYRVTVCDARPAFATARRFPLADEIVVDWPHRLVERLAGQLGLRDAICVLTHDHKFDVPAITSALATDVGYLGAMGSRRTAARRGELLVEAGVTPAQLERLHAPIGLDIAARTPEETAIAICAEIISVQTGRTAASLKDTDGSIHAGGQA